MPSNIHSAIRLLRAHWQSAVFGAVVLGFIALLGMVFFLRGQVLMEQQIKGKLRSTAAMAAQQFDADAIRTIADATSMGAPAFRDLVERLRGIRQAEPDIRFAYIMRRTPDPMTLEFVADADSLSSDAELDRDGNGEVNEDEEASFPGDPYPVNDVPALQHDAFERPTVDEEVTVDQWGAVMSGYAPVRDKNGTAVAVLGIDMSAAEYQALTRSIFSPVAFLLLCLAAVLFAAYVIVYLSRRSLETLRRIDEERAGMMLLASHQLGTPLTIFRWTVESMKEDLAAGKLPADIIERDIRNLSEASDRLSNILRDLREASDVEAGHMVYKYERTYAREVVTRALHELSEQFKQTGQRVKTVIQDDFPLSVDRRLIGSVLRELLQNALTFSGGKGTITVTVRKHRNTAELEVRDEGIGIPRKDLVRVFGKFVRGSNAHLSRPDGNGLGLFIARGIVERAGGNMRIESEEGKGTTVSFTLPVEGREQ